VERRNVFVRLATLGPIGYLPAPGTAATAVSLFPIFLFSFFRLSQFVYGLLLLGILVAGFYIVGRALESFRLRDPSEVVFDELIGCFDVFWCVPISLFSLAIGFFLFRFFDILKPLGLKKTEVLYGSFGVIADDVLAGMLANVLLRAILHYWQ